MQPKSLTAIHNQARDVRNQKVLTKLAYVKCVQVLKHVKQKGISTSPEFPAFTRIQW